MHNSRESRVTGSSTRTFVIAALATFLPGIAFVAAWFVFFRSTPDSGSGATGEPEFIGTVENTNQAALLEPFRSQMSEDEFEKTFGPAIKEEQENPEIVISSSADIDALPPRVGRLSAPTITNAGLSRLAKKVSIRELDLNENKNITDEGLRHVASIRGLEELGVSHTGIGDKGVEHLANCSLTYFSAWYCNLGDRALKVLSGMPRMKQLQLKGCAGITDSGIAHLSKLQHLWMLNISECTRVTDRSVPTLAAIPSLTFIQAIDSGITETGADEYQARRPSAMFHR
ncbi:MAG: hypothetical protein KF754_12455 [Planctomycetes bacterium]|nr:hypothetical protein [Planctomycetota bacterium]